MKTIHNKTSRYTGKNRYRVIAPHQDRTNAQGGQEHVKLCINNGRHTMDGDLEAGWNVSSLNTESRTYKSFEDAAQDFKERTGEEPPAPRFEPDFRGVTL